MAQANNQALLQLVGLAVSDDLTKYEDFIGGTELAAVLREKQAEERKAAIASTAETVMNALRLGQKLTDAAIEKVRKARAELAAAEKNLDIMLATQEAARGQDFFPVLVTTNQFTPTITGWWDVHQRYNTWVKEQAPVLAKKAKARHQAQKAGVSAAPKKTAKAAPKAADK